jgi:phosphoribosylformylglycinamidine synthase subunit PurL
MVGLIDKEEHITTQWFKDAGDTIILVGAGGGVGTVAGVGDPGSGKASHSSTGINDPGYSLGGSQFLKVCCGKKIGPPPRVDLELEIDVQNAVRDLIREGLVKSAHDCSEGGLSVALAESCFNPSGRLGADVRVGQASGLRTSEDGKPEACATLFNESQSRIVISVAAKDAEKTMSILRARGVPFQQLGEVGGDELWIRAGDETFRWPVSDLYDDWFNAIRRAVASDSATERIPNL